MYIIATLITSQNWPKEKAIFKGDVMIVRIV
jgi:hypothetical protein